jgi:hypothetical protein
LTFHFKYDIIITEKRKEENKMKVEMKEVLTLTTEEKKLINNTHNLILDILQATNDPDLYLSVKKICDGFEEFGYLVDTEVE